MEVGGARSYTQQTRNKRAKEALYRSPWLEADSNKLRTVEGKDEKL